MGIDNSHDIYEVVYFTAIGKSEPSQDAEGCVTTAALMRCRGILLDYYKLAFVTTLRGRLTEDGSLQSSSYFYFLLLCVQLRVTARGTVLSRDVWHSTSMYHDGFCVFAFIPSGKARPQNE